MGSPDPTDAKAGGSIRRLAAWLLRITLRFAPAETRTWTEAMLFELDFVEGDWAALFWALGCTGAILRECLLVWATWLARQCASLFGNKSTEEEAKMNSTGKKTLGVLSGIGLALALGVGLFLLRNVIADALQAVGIQRSMMSHILSVVLPAEVIVVVAAIILWRRKYAPVAVGLLLTGFVMAAHVVVIVASH
jgi:hypothetical protein